MVLLVGVVSGDLMAQMDEAVPEKDLLAPWVQAKAVVLSLPDRFDNVIERGKGLEFERQLSKLESELARLESQMDTVTVRIATDPQFPYVASDVSLEMSTQVGAIKEAFDSLFSEPAASDRPDVRATQESLDILRRLLSEKDRFERDVVRALGSGSRHEILALATRWSVVANSVQEVRDSIDHVQRQLAVRSKSDAR